MERLLNSLRANSGQRFFLLYGPGISDLYVSDRYVELNFEQALLETLRRQGFQRVIYVSHQRHIYFWDAESRRLSRPNDLSAQVQENTASAPAIMAGFQGPLGSTWMLDTPRAPLQSTPGQDPESSAMGSMHMVRVLNHIMQGKHNRQNSGATPLRSAVVFQNAETLMRYSEAQGALTGWITEWNRLPGDDNENICVFLFASPQYGDLTTAVNNLQVPELQQFFASNLHQPRQHGNVTYVSAPEVEELNRVVDFARLRYGVRVAWPQRDRLVPQLAAQNVSVREWLKRFREAQEVSRETMRPYLDSASRDGRTAREQLDELIGLHLVKEKVEEQEALARLEVNNTSEHRAEAPSAHMMFIGNPGTGKTTVARLIGELYREIGRLRRGHLVEVENASQLVGDVVGATAIKTNNVIDQALDGVLFIDEAYQLADRERGGFGKEAIETLLTRMENARDKLVVIVAGYPEPMKQFLEANPGLPRRFPERNRIVFADYVPEDLMRILEKMLSDRRLSYDENGEMAKLLRQVLQGMYDSRNETFGNAGDVREFAESLRVQHALRCVRRSLSAEEPLQPEDIADLYRVFLQSAVPDMDTLLADLNKLVGLESVKKKVTAWQAVIRLKRKKGQATSVNSLHMVFEGPPGTGKTTVARLMGRILKGLGLLRKGHVVEVSRAELIGSVVGRSEELISRKIKDALDGVLFIDEAYALVQEHEGGFGKSVLNVLIKAMEDHRDRLVVIVAGYPEEMKAFLNSNSGFGSRFNEKLSFNEYTRTELVEVLRRMALEHQYNLSPKAAEAAANYLERERAQNPRSFGNARAVRNLFDKMEQQYAIRVMSLPDDETLVDTTLEAADVPADEQVASLAHASAGRGNAASYAVNTRQGFNLVSLLPPPPSDPLSMDRVRQAMCYIVVRTNEGTDGSGSGFAVTPQGHLLTSYHVVEHANQIGIRLNDQLRVLPAQVVGWDSAVDIAVLKLPDPGGPETAAGGYTWLPLAEQGYQPDHQERVVAWGWPLGDQLGSEVSSASGEINSRLRTGPSGEELIQTDAVVTHGSSGGPLLRASDKRVIGVVQGGIKQQVAAGINFAVSTQEIYRRFGGATGGLGPGPEAGSNAQGQRPSPAGAPGRHL